MRCQPVVVQSLVTESPTVVDPYRIGDYAGKFISGQVVFKRVAPVQLGRLVRAIYRDFLYPHQRWLFYREIRQKRKHSGRDISQE